MHDANVLKDRAAVAIVLRSGVPLRLLPIATGAHLTITSGDRQRLAARGQAGRYLADRSRMWLWFWNTFGGTGGGAVFDALAILAAARPDLIHFDPAARTSRQTGI